MPAHQTISDGIEINFFSSFFAQPTPKNQSRFQRIKHTPKNADSRNRNSLCRKASRILKFRRVLTKWVPPQVIHFPPSRSIKHSEYWDNIRSESFSQRIIPGITSTSAATNHAFLGIAFFIRTPAEHTKRPLLNRWPFREFLYHTV